MAKRAHFARNRNPLTWALRHLQMSLSALGRLTRNPLPTLMTAAVIGIAIALPAGLSLLIDNVRHLSNSWEGSSSISLYLQDELSDEQAEQVRAQIALRADIAEARLITKAQALQEFRELSGFGEAVDLLDSNPLPAVVLVQPSQQVSSAEAAEQLANALQAYREIDLAQVDLQWVRRLAAITETIQRAVLLLAALLSAAVLLVIGNTIRLEIQNRHAEIEIVKLVGGTDAFIRRPFLYEGLWYGLFGALIAIVLVLIAMLLMQGPVAELAGLYTSSFSLNIAQISTLLLMLLGGPLLGWLGAWLAVGKHLQRIVPQ